MVINTDPQCATFYYVIEIPLNSTNHQLKLDVVTIFINNLQN